MAEGFVKRQCLVNLSIESYQDKILCDVLDMSVCHVLLGRPWQYDLKSVHDGFSNIYIIRHERKLTDRRPLPPHRSLPPTKDTKVIQLVTKRECSREIQLEGRMYLLFSKICENWDSEPKDPQLQALLLEFCDLFAEDLSEGLPPLIGIEH